MDYRKLMTDCGQPEYDHSFWNLMRGDRQAEQKMQGGHIVDAAAYAMPNGANGSYEKAVAKESVMRQISPVLCHYSGSASIWAVLSDDIAEFVPEAEGINIKDVIDDFSRILVGRYKLTSLLRLPMDFVSDAAFDLEGYLIKRLARAMVRAEDKAFIAGTGTDEPAGLLNDAEGAEIGAPADALSFDSVIDHYFSVKPEYRKNGVWLMNDETALTLKKLGIKKEIYHCNDPRQAGKNHGVYAESRSRGQTDSLRRFQLLLDRQTQSDHCQDAPGTVLAQRAARLPWH